MCIFSKKPKKKVKRSLVFICLAVFLFVLATGCSLDDDGIATDAILNSAPANTSVISALQPSPTVKPTAKATSEPADTSYTPLLPTVTESPSPDTAEPGSSSVTSSADDNAGNSHGVSDNTPTHSETPKPQETPTPQETVKPHKTNAPHKTAKPQETSKPRKTDAPHKTAKPQETPAPQKTAKPQSTDIPQKTTEPTETPQPDSSSGGKYILNTNTKKFHYPSCSSVDKMKEKNKRVSNDSRDTIIAQGYVPCKRCKP